MSNNNIEELTERLQNLSFKRIYAEEALDTINQETNLVEYQLRVACSARRRYKATNTGTINKNKITSVLEIFSVLRTNAVHTSKEVKSLLHQSPQLM